MSTRLDPLTLPLRGSRLIEASAGTGKTWTIAALYLRLVLGHGDHGTREPRALLPAQILVMTFTRAATRELSSRIRERLIDAARLFRDPAALAASAGAGAPLTHRGAAQAVTVGDGADGEIVQIKTVGCGDR